MLDLGPEAGNREQAMALAMAAGLLETLSLVKLLRI